MLIETENLTANGKPFNYTFRASEFSLDTEEEGLRLLEDVKVNGRVARERVRVRIKGDLETRVAKPCDRCLTPQEMSVTVSFDELFVPLEIDLTRTSPVLEAEDLVTSVMDGTTINLDEVVREQILLATQSRTLCRDDCRGLCLNCGANLNDRQCSCVAEEVDPRWAALGALRDNN